MGMHKVSEWRKLPLSLSELCIETTLRCGQSFRWRKISDEWHCVLRGRLVTLRQDASHLHYRVTWPSTSSKPLMTPPSVPSPASKADDVEGDDTTSLLHNYFALSLSASSLYAQWAASDANFARRAPAFTGIRILNQDAWEALVAFICSSNNNISRISQMVQKLCLHYGPYVATIQEEPFHDFPPPEALSGEAVEAHLRELGFGYRAKYIASTARMVSLEKPTGWLLRLRNPECPTPGDAPTTTKVEDQDQPPTYRDAHDALLQLPGVGPKVADCVCLMGLGWGEAVPIDTHVWQIAQRDYKLGGKATKTLNKAMYDAVGDHFRGIWGPQAGWAQSVLFTANLKSFSEQASGATAKERVMQTKATEPRTGSVSTTMGRTKKKTIMSEAASITIKRTRKRAIMSEAASAHDLAAADTAESEPTLRRTSKRIRVNMQKDRGLGRSNTRP